MIDEIDGTTPSGESMGDFMRRLESEMEGLRKGRVKTGYKTVAVYLKTETKEKLSAIAQQHHWSLSKLIDIVLDNFLKEYATKKSESKLLE